MANIAIYDKSTNKVLQILKSVNTPDYDGRDDVVVNPSLPEGVPIKFLKQDGGQIVEMSQAEKDAVLQEEADAEEQKLLDAIDKYEISNVDLITALVKVINVRIPTNKITKEELIQQIKTDMGL